MEDGASRLLPIDSGNFSIEKPDVRDEVLLIVRREHIRDGRLIGRVRSSGGCRIGIPSPSGTIAFESGARMAA